MNDLIQTLLVYLALILAVAFLVKKFFFKEASSKKSCGKDNGCGCS
ncbi:MAG TPA: FeoB-associated Cys-rich membrane protein [Flavobacteriaceae bacterium]|nr:FeoB-associated Cys-rich membrane protein [Flavobacteriaceae bacterium]